MCVCVVVRLLYSARAGAQGRAAGPGAQGRAEGVIWLVCGGEELGLANTKTEILMYANSLGL